MGYVSFLKVLTPELIFNPRVVFLKAIFFPDLIHKNGTLYQPCYVSPSEKNLLAETELMECVHVS